MRIIHSLCMVAGCAVGFATYRGLTPPLNAAFRSFGLFYDMAMGGALGLILTGGFILAWRRWRGDVAAMTQPGHWILAFGLATALAVGGAIAAYYGRSHAGRPPDATVTPPHWVQFDMAWAPTVQGMFHQVVGWGLGGTVALGFCVASFHRLRWHWWALFLVSALGSLYLFAGHAALLLDFRSYAASISWYGHAAHLYGKLVAVCLLLLVFASTRDAWQGRRGDGLHWTGVSAWIVILTMQLALYYQFMLGPMPFSQAVRVLFTL